MIENGQLKLKGKGIWQFSIANESTSSVLSMGIQDKGNAFLKIPVKPEDAPAYPRVWSTNNPEIPFDDDFIIQFENGAGHAQIILFTTVDPNAPTTIHSEGMPGE